MVDGSDSDWRLLILSWPGTPGEGHITTCTAWDAYYGGAQLLAAWAIYLPITFLPRFACYVASFVATLNDVTCSALGRVQSSLALFLFAAIRHMPLPAGAGAGGALSRPAWEGGGGVFFCAMANPPSAPTPSRMALHTNAIQKNNNNFEVINPTRGIRNR
jgi:hypothetical protein